MKKFVTAMLIVLSFISCSKDKDDVPEFSAPGYWSGTIGGLSTVIVNNINGTAKVYIGYTDQDTATAQYKLNGTYTVGNDIYEAVFTSTTSIIGYIRFETTSISPRVLSGLATFSTGVTHPFQLIKQ